MNSSGLRYFTTLLEIGFRSAGSSVKRFEVAFLSQVFVATPRCHKFANKICRHDLIRLLETPNNSNFVHKGSYFRNTFFLPNKDHLGFLKIIENQI